MQRASLSSRSTDTQQCPQHLPEKPFPTAKQSPVPRTQSRTRFRVTGLAPPPPCAPASGSRGRVSSDQKRPAALSLVSSSPVTPGRDLGPHALGQPAAAFVLRLGSPFLPLWQAVVSGARLQPLRPLPLRWGRLPGRTRQCQLPAACLRVSPLGEKNCGGATLPSRGLPSPTSVARRSP